MSNRTRGATFGAFLVGTAVCGVITGGVLYFFSDTFRTRANETYRQLSEWTPENIAEDPINYLNFAEEETRGVLDTLKASEIAIAQKRSKLEVLGNDAAQKVAVGTKALAELKAMFKIAELDGNWPVEWSGVARDRDWTKRQIVTLYRQLEGQQELIRKTEQGGEHLQVQLTKIFEARAQCEEQIARISTHREMLKVEAITDQLTEQLVEMKSVISTTIASTLATDSGNLLSLDDLAAASQDAVDDSEFEAILND